MKNIIILMIIVLLTTKTSSRSYRNLKLTTIQSTGSLDGLGCAVDEPLLWSGAKYDPQTGACTKLPKNWFASPTYEPNHAYFKLMELGNIVPETAMNNTLIPPIFIPGGTVMVMLQTTNTPNTGLVLIDFVQEDFTRNATNLFGTIALFNQLAPPYHKFNSFLNGFWGGEEAISYQFTQPNSLYILGFHFTDTQVEIYLHTQVATLLHSYTHRTSLDMYGRVWFYEGDNLNLKMVWFRYY